MKLRYEALNVIYRTTLTRALSKSKYIVFKVSWLQS